MNKKLRFSFLSLVLVGLFFSCNLGVGLGEQVDALPPTMTIENPPIDAIIRGEFALSGKWSDDGEVQSVDIVLERTDGLGKAITLEGVVTKDSETRTGTWSVNIDPKTKNYIDGSYQATITAKDGGKHKTSVTRTFKIDNTAPLIVLERPSAKNSDATADSYGQSFTLVGQAADDNNVGLINVEIYSDPECNNKIYTVPLKNVPNTINLDVAKFVEDEENTYYEIYGSTKKEGTKPFYCKIIAYDDAKRYPIEGERTAEDDLGNITSTYYLYEEIATSVLSNYKLPEVYKMYSGEYFLSKDRAINSIGDIQALLEGKIVDKGYFSLNPANNPTFTVSGRESIKKDGTDFKNTTNNLSDKGNLVIEVSPGLDAIPIEENSIKVYIQNCSENGEGTGDKIYIEDVQKSKSGTSYKLVAIINKSDKIKIGQNYIIGIDGSDQSNNEIVPNGAGFGFHFAPSGIAPKFSDMVTYINGVKSSSENNLYVPRLNPGKVSENTTIKLTGKVSSDDPDFSLTIKLDGKALSGVEIKKIEGKDEEYTFETTFTTEDISESTKSAQHEITISAKNTTESDPISKIVMYDTESPTVTIDEFETATKYDSAKEDGSIIEGDYLNGKVTLKIRISDDENGTGIAVSGDKQAYYEIAGTKYYIDTPSGQKVTIDTNLLEEGPLAIVIHAWDKAGNETVFNRSFIIDQSTDKPYIGSSDTTSLVFSECSTKAAVEAIKADKTTTNKKNIFEKNTPISFNLYDDDGLAKYILKVAKWNENTSSLEQNEIPDGHYDSAANKAAGKTTKGTSKTVSYTPINTGYYKVTLTTFDSNYDAAKAAEENENFVFERSFWILVTGPAPVVNVNKDKDIITTATTNLSDIAGFAAKTSFTNTIDIDSVDGPFTIVRIENKSATETIETVLCGEYNGTNSGVDAISSTSYTDTFVPNAERLNNKVTYKVIDSNGHSGEKTISYNVDNTLPVVENLTVPTSTINGNTVNVTTTERFTFKADLSDKVPVVNTYSETASSVAKIQYKFETNGTVYTNDVSTFNQEIYFSDVFTSEGEKTIYVRAVDEVGNMSDWVSKNFIYDKANPSSTVNGIQEFIPENGFTLSGTAEDSNGVKKVEIFCKKPGSEAYDSTPIYTANANSAKAYNWTKVLAPEKNESNQIIDGKYSYKVIITDIADKTETANEFTVTVDITKPEISFASSLYDSTNGDLKKGTNSIDETNFRFSGNYTEINLNGMYYQILASSAAAPVAPANPLNSESWANWNLVTTGTSTWNLYQAFKAKGSSETALEEGSYKLYIYGVDKAGNLSDLKTLSFDVDMATPTVTENYTAGAESNFNKDDAYIYFYGSLNLTTTAADSNGIENLTVKLGDTEKTLVDNKCTISEEDFKKDGVVEEGVEKTLKITAKDIVGKETSKTYTIVVDKSAPSIDILNPDSDISGEDSISTNTYKFRATVKDDGVGIKDNKYKYVFTQNLIADTTDLSKYTEEYSGQAFTQEKTITVKSDTGTNKLNEGQWYLYIYAVDKLGKSKVAKRSFMVDKANPKVTVKIGGSTVEKSADYTDSTVITTKDSGIKVYFAASDTHGLDTTFGLTDSEDSSKKLGIEIALVDIDGNTITPTISKDVNGYYLVLPENPADSTYTYTVKAKDLAGKTTTVIRSVRLDTTGPTIETKTPVFTEDAETNQFISGWQKSTSVTITGLASDASAVSTVYFMLNPASTPSTDNLAGWTAAEGTTNWEIELPKKISDETTIALNESATNKLWITAVDNQGNVSDAICRTIKVDSVAPVLTETGVGLTGKKYTASDATNKVTFTGAFSDATSGIKEITIEDSMSNFETITISNTASWSKEINISSLKDGEHTITITGIDLAGNKTTLQRSVVVDTQAPSADNISVANTNKSTYEGASNNQNWYKSSSNIITVTGISDSLKDGYKSDIASVDYSTNANDITPVWIGMTKDSVTPTTYTANVNCSNQGSNTITVRVKDAVGNTTTKDVTIYIDTEKPSAPTAYTVTYGGTEYKTNGGLFTDQIIVNGRNPVVITLNPTDSGSGIKEISKGTSTAGDPTAEGVYTITVAASDLVTGGINISLKDNIDNSTTWNPFTVLKDNDAPSVTITDPKDADEESGIQVNGTITLEGRAKDTGGSDLKQVDICYATSDNASSWTHLSTITSDLNNWSVANIDTTSAFGSLTEPATVYICAIVTDNAGNRNTDTTSGGTVTDNTKLDGADGTTGNLIPTKKPSEIAAANIKTIIVNQDTDRPKIALTNVSLSGMGKITESGVTTTTYAYLNNTNTLYGIASDDDGISSIYYNKREVLTGDTAPADWTGDSKVTRYSDAACSTEVEDYAAGTYYVKQQITTSSSGSFSIADLPEGANEIHFWVTDTEGSTFPSENKAAPKVTGNESGAEVKTVVYLRINTEGPVISDLTFQRYDSTTSDYEKNAAGAYITKTLAELNSTYTFGGTKYTKVKVTAKVEDANGVKSVKIGDIAGTASAKGTGYYDIEVPLSSITESGPAKFTIEAEDNIPDINGKSASIKSTQSFDITIDKTAPTIKVTSHTVGATIRSTYTLKGTIDDANASMKYVITDSATLANDYDWSSSNTNVKSYSGDTIVSWDITFDGDTLNEDEFHDIDQKDYFVSLYGSSAKSGTTYGIVKNTTTGTILEKTSATDTAGDANKKYITKKTFYFHFLLTDALGNSAVDNSFNLLVDPQGDIPVIEMTNPVVESYAYYDSTATDKFKQQTLEEYAEGTLPTGMTASLYRGAYGTASGRINIAGYAEDDKAIAGIYIQIDPTYDAKDGFKWVGATDALPNGKTLGYSEYGYTIKTIQHNGEDVKINNESVNAIYIGDSTSWSIKLNAKNEFNGVGTNNNTIAVKLFAIDTDGNLLAPSDIEIFIITIDSGAPKIGESVEFALWQYAWVNATEGTLYTNTDTPNNSSKAYTDVLCTTGETDLTVGTGKITVGGKDYTKAFVNKPYKDSDFWLQGKWWLVGSVEDESGISSIKVTDSKNTDKEIDSAYKESQTYACTASGKTDYLVRYPVDLTGKYGKATYTLSVKDNQDKDNSATFAINFDNNPPTLAGTTDSSFNISEDVVNTDGFYTMGSAVTEGDGESGFARTVVYFKRTATGYQKVYDVFLDKTTSPIAYSGLHYEDGLYWQSATAGTITAVDGSTNSTVSVTTTSNVHKGGIVKFGGNIYTIKDKDSSSITIDGIPSTSLNGSTIYFAIGAVIDRIGTEGSASGANKISSGEGKGYWDDISGDDDFIIEKVNIQGTKAIWEGNINTKNIPDGPIEIHYVVYDKAGNSSHGSVTQNAFVKNNAPMIASVTVATTFTGGDTPEYEETYYVSEKTRKIGGKEVKKSIGVSKDVTVQGSRTGYAFMTIKDKSWVKPEIVGGNGALSYTYQIDDADAVSGGSLGDATVEGGEEYLNATDQNENKYVSGQELTFPITTAMLNTITTNSTVDSPTTFLYTISDSTEGVTGGLKATATVLLALNHNDTSVPKVAIDPFEWNGTGTSDYSVRENGQTVVYCTYPNNNLYEGSTENGHIEVEKYLPTTFKATGATDNLMDRDPKVSGKISIRGYAYDDIRLSKLWIKMDSFTFTGKTASTETGTSGYIEAATFDASTKTWTGSGDFDTNGWRFTVLASDGDFQTLPSDTTSADYKKKHSNNLGAYYGSYFNKEGHKVYWQLDLNTEKLTSVAGLNKKLTVLAEAEKGGATYKYSNATSKVETGTDNVKNVPFYQMDVVPYITGVDTLLSDKDKTIKGSFSRTSSGKYAVSSAESVGFNGFNLIGGTAVFTNESTGVTASSGKYAIPSTARSGNVKVVVNSVDSINNINNNDAGSVGAKTISVSSSYSDMSNYAYNRKPNNVTNNRLTDDVYFDIWELDGSAASSGSSMRDPVMHINPSTDQIGFGYVRGSDSVSFPANGYSYTWYQKNRKDYKLTNFVYDSAGVAHNVSIGLDAQFDTGIAGRMLYNNSNWYAGNDGESYIKQWDMRYSISLESIGIPNNVYLNGTIVNESGGKGIIDIDRFALPKIAAAKHGTTGTGVYIMYYDTRHKQIRFRYGEVPNSGANRTSTQYGLLDDASCENYNGNTSTTTISSDTSNQNDTWAAHDMFEAAKANYALIAGDYYRQTNDGKTGTVGTKIISTNNTGSEFYDISVVPSTTLGGDKVVMIWYDLSAKKLMYMYRENLVQNNTTKKDNTDASSTGVSGKWSTPKAIWSNKIFQDCAITVDKNNGIHIAAYEQNNEDLVYAYLPTYNHLDTSGNKPYTCIVDAYSKIGTKLTIDTALKDFTVGETTVTRVVPYISYCAEGMSSLPKYAYLVNGIDNTNDTTRKATVVDGSDGSTNLFSGAWEVTMIPTSSVMMAYNINVGVWKDSSNGKIKTSPARVTTAGATQNHTSFDVKQRKYTGNGITDVVLGYQIKRDGIDYIETAMRR